MNKPKIDAQHITKPIQLLAAWLAGLVLTNAALLSTAIAVGQSTDRTILICAAVADIPVFLIALFILQTRFRPEMQSDEFYADYVSKKNNAVVEVSRLDVIEAKLQEAQTQHSFLLTAQEPPDQSSAIVVPEPAALDWSSWDIAINKKLPFYKELRGALRLSGIPVSTSFGENIKEELEDYVIFFAQDMPHSHVLAILKVAIYFPFDKFDFWTPFRELGENEDVYMGAYGNHSDGMEITDKVKEFIVKSQGRLDIKAITG